MNITSFPFYQFGAPELARRIAGVCDAVGRECCRDVRIEDDRGVLTIEVPGVPPEDLSVKVAGRVVTVSVSRAGGPVSRQSFRVGAEYDLDAIEAKLDLGVLTISIPKSAEAQPREVKIQS